MSQRIKAVLVTNASDYAGRPAVDALSDAGFRVLVHDRRFADVAFRGAFSAAHPHAEYIPAVDGPSLVQAAWAAAGELDVIVSNDHYPAVQVATESASIDDLRLTLETLVVGPFALLQAAIPRFRQQGHGNIVVITSCRTSAPIPGGAIPDAARAASNALVKSLAIELAPFEIAVNAIAPNFLYSEAYYPRATFIENPAGREFIKETVPIGRLGRPDEIGEVVTFLATTRARFMTGAIIDFNGGWPAGKVRPT